MAIFQVASERKIVKKRGTYVYGKYREYPSGTVRYGTVRYGTVRYGTVRYGTVRYGTVRYKIIYLVNFICATL